MNHFKGKQFKKDVIIVAVGYYLRYNLSYREVQVLLYDRGINVCHTKIYRWVQEYSKVLYTASSTIKGMETLRGIYKKNRRNGTLFGFSESTEIKVLMGITA